jgi:hypothetical protein
VIRRGASAAVVVAGCGGGGAASDDEPDAFVLPGVCADADVDYDGRCTDGGLARCEDTADGAQVIEITCAAETACRDDAGPAACLPRSCAAIGPQGRCAGDVLSRCVDDAPAHTQCAASGQVCTYLGDADGYGCADPAEVGALAVAGTIRYEDRPQLTTGRLGPIETRAARGARVSVIRDRDAAVLAIGVVADDGSYRLHYDAELGAEVHILAASQSPLTVRPISVTDRPGAVHGFGGPTFGAARSVTADVLATDASAASEAFNILDVTVDTMDWVVRELGRAAPPSLRLIWSRGNATGTYYTNRTIYLLGEDADDDGYDDTVILHETGHYVEAQLGRTDSPGGFHDGRPTDPNLAWSEGFATYWSNAMLDAPHYMDSYSGGTRGWSFNAETSTTRAQADGALNQPVSENMINEILWDLGDGGDADDDAVVDTGHGAVVRVQSEYLRTAALRPVGEPGVDLVDFLDGWFVGQGLELCAGTRAIVTTVRLFPYDYAGPAGACP